MKNRLRDHLNELNSLPVQPEVGEVDRGSMIDVLQHQGRVLHRVKGMHAALEETDPEELGQPEIKAVLITLLQAQAAQMTSVAVLLQRSINSKDGVGG